MKSHRHKRRRGYTLVFFAVFLFGFMAMAALVIDIGFARLTQRQMQTAADSAALEGLRFQDEIPSSLIVSYQTELEAACGPVDQNDPTWHDCARRWFAAKRVNDTFDDDLDTTDDDGAFDTGSGQFGAGPLVEFTGGEGDPTLVASQMMSVDPNAPVYKPVMLNGSNGLLSTSRFQVAIQRGITDVPTADLYSLGPPVPYLFARGSLVPRQLIQEGMKVHGTSIAEARPALSVGAPQPIHGIPGSLAIAVDLSLWRGAPSIASTDCFESNARVIGDLVYHDVSTVTDQSGFVGLFLETAEIDRRVVAFGFGHVDSNGDVTPDTTRLIFAENVSGVFVERFDATANIASILDQLGGLRYEMGVVHAPVSVK